MLIWHNYGSVNTSYMPAKVYRFQRIATRGIAAANGCAVCVRCWAPNRKGTTNLAEIKALDLTHLK